MDKFTSPEETQAALDAVATLFAGTVLLDLMIQVGAMPPYRETVSEEDLSITE
jgi:hypothetical protein